MTPDDLRAARKARRYRYVDAGRCPADGRTATHGQLCEACYGRRQRWLLRSGRATGLPVGRKRSPQGDAWAVAYQRGESLSSIARRSGVTVGAVQSACRVRGVYRPQARRKGGV